MSHTPEQTIIVDRRRKRVTLYGSKLLATIAALAISIVVGGLVGGLLALFLSLLH